MAVAGVPITFTGGASLVDQLDTLVMIILRDGRHLLGTLRSYDQFANVVLENTRERHFADGKFCDIELGLYIVRGDTIVLIGEVDEDLEARGGLPLVEAPVEDVVTAEAALDEEARRRGQVSYKAGWNMDGGEA